jgi:hypothetical protein
MNSIEIGRKTELNIARKFNKQGYYVSYCNPNRFGQQSCNFSTLRMPKVELNQELAFQRWINCGGTYPFFLIECKDKYYKLNFGDNEKNISPFDFNMLK